MEWIKLIDALKVNPTLRVLKLEGETRLFGLKHLGN